MDQTVRNRWMVAAGLALVVIAAIAAHGLSNRTPTSPSATLLGASGGLRMVPNVLNEPVKPMTQVRHGKDVTIHLYAQERIVTIAPHVQWAGFTFDGRIPGPVMILHQGDHVTVDFRNLDPYMPHSLDLHAATGNPAVNNVDVMPGQEHVIHFIANTPGVFMYHCDTMPMWIHIDKGMYGETIVLPHNATAPPTIDLVQSEFYSSVNALLNGSPKYVVFNGKADQYANAPIRVKVGVPVTIAIVNAGPNSWSAFHIVGALLSTVQPSGSAQTVLRNVQTYSIAPGDGALITVMFRQPGMYPFVTHSMRDAAKGAVGLIIASR